MTPIRIELTDCIQCGECEAACLYNAIYMDEYPVIEQDRCLLCRSCIMACPLELITIDEALTDPSSFDEIEAKGIWVMAELQGRSVDPVTFELLGAARSLAETNKEEVGVVLIGNACQGYEKELVAAGADHVYVAESTYLTDKLEEMYADVLVELVRTYRPSVLLIGATHFGRGVSARAASILHTGLTADCIRLEIDHTSKRLLQIRPAFGGNLLATIETPHHRPQMASVRPGVMSGIKPDDTRIGRVTNCSINHLVTNSKVEVLAEEIATACSSPADATVLVAGGKGMQGKENIDLLYQLADLLGGKVAASRAAVEAGWLPYECQVGQTGKTVKPRLYIACGISGQIQHTVGIGNAETIIAINNDPYAPIFGYADYGFVGDVAEILPALIKELQFCILAT